MKLKRLKVEHFGCYSYKVLTFSDGWNMVVGANEAGKTTMSAAIQYALFGVQAKTAKSYISPKTVITLKLQWQDKWYHLVRQQRKLQVLDDSGSYLGGDQYWRQLFPYSWMQFQRLYVLQAKQMTPKMAMTSDEWQQLLRSYQTIGTDQLAKWQQHYQKEKQYLYQSRKKQGRLFDLMQEQQKLIQAIEAKQQAPTSHFQEKLEKLQHYQQKIMWRLEYLEEYQDFQKTAETDYSAMAQLLRDWKKWQEMTWLKQERLRLKHWLEQHEPPEIWEKRWQMVQEKRQLCFFIAIGFSFVMLCLPVPVVAKVLLSVGSFLSVWYIGWRYVQSLWQGQPPYDEEAYQKWRKDYYQINAQWQVHHIVDYQSVSSAVSTEITSAELEQLEASIQKQRQLYGLETSSYEQAMQRYQQQKQEEDRASFYYQLYENQSYTRQELEEELHRIETMKQQYIAAQQKQWQSEAQIGHQSLARLYQEKARVDSQLYDAVKTYQKLVMKLNWLKDLEEAGQNQQLPQIMHETEKWFKLLTEGRYQQVAWRAGQLMVKRQQEWQPSEELSTGTKGQLLMSLRFAFIHAQPDWKRCPVLLDDVWTFFDSRRQYALFQLLKQTDTQVISFGIQYPSIEPDVLIEL